MIASLTLEHFWLAIGGLAALIAVGASGRQVVLRVLKSAWGKKVGAALHSLAEALFGHPFDTRFARRQQPGLDALTAAITSKLDAVQASNDAQHGEVAHRLDAVEGRLAKVEDALNGKASP